MLAADSDRNHDACDSRIESANTLELCDIHEVLRRATPAFTRTSEHDASIGVGNPEIRRVNWTGHLPLLGLISEMAEETAGGGRRRS